jgi:3-dehydroquinate synthase
VEEFSVANLDFTVTSSSGTYEVRFLPNVLGKQLDPDRSIIIIDDRVAELFDHRFSREVRECRRVSIAAHEETKSLEQLPRIVEKLVELNVRKDDHLVAIGGGITQDITAFLSATIFRGMSWTFYPTTLLAQADSCIGSKSSINAAGIKNLLGTFRAPTGVTIDTGFLRTLSADDVRSGLGEMLKVHAIAGPAEFDELSEDYDKILEDDGRMLLAIHRSLLIKKQLIEVDEFDRGARNVMNYGHSFGHAIEAATDYGIPHGIAVTIGMDMANYVAGSIGHSVMEPYKRMHPVLSLNYQSFADFPILPERLISALKRDKKNSATHLRLVLPDDLGRIGMVNVEASPLLESAVQTFIESHKGN